MLTPQQIQQALQAVRVVPLRVPNSHGLMGLDQLAETVIQLVQARGSASGEGLIERPISLPVATWEKLDQLARRTNQSASQPTSASAVAAALLAQCVAE